MGAGRPNTPARLDIKVMLADLLAGIAIFPAVFAFGFKPDAGPALLFVTIPAVFAAMPFGHIFMVLFFVLAAFAATGTTPFDLYDFTTSNVLLPLGGLLICVLVGWAWGFAEIRRALSNEGALRNERLARIFYGVVKFVTPVLVLIVLLNGLKLL